MTPAPQPPPAAAPSIGVITLDGVAYVERPQVFSMRLDIGASNEEHSNQRLTMPGEATFLLKGLTRDCVIVPPPSVLSSKDGEGPPVVGRLGLPSQFNAGSQDRRFRFRLLGGQGTPYYFTAGLGVIDDWAVDTLCFGSGQFPFPLIPPVPVPSNGSLIFDVWDMGLGSDPSYYPYTIYFGFHGSYLFPVQG